MVLIEGAEMNKMSMPFRDGRNEALMVVRVVDFITRSCRGSHSRSNRCIGRSRWSWVVYIHRC